MPADLWGFLKILRIEPPRRVVPERLRDWRVMIEPPRRVVPERLRDWRVMIEPLSARNVERQAVRCMDCSVPFCHAACPLGSLIPEWNGLVATSQWRHSVEALHGTNNFPEFTGWLCQVPCGPPVSSPSTRTS